MAETGTDYQLENYEVVAAEHPCPICGKKIFEWGIVSRFTPLTYRRGFRFFRSDPSLGVKARHCLTCDHIQLFVDEGLSSEQRRAALWVWLAAFVAVVILASIVLVLIT
ncbi:MAG: hypothetical protein AAF787_12915 [Chloroflexota bacterium]